MLAEKRTAAIGTGIIGPEENENTQRQQHVVMYLAIESWCLETQYIDHWERQGDVQLREHSVSPIVDGIFVACVQLADEEIEDGEQIRYENHEIAHNAHAETSYGKEEVNTRHGADETVYRNILLLVN